MEVSNFKYVTRLLREVANPVIKILARA